MTRMCTIKQSLKANDLALRIVKIKDELQRAGKKASPLELAKALVNDNLKIYANDYGEITRCVSFSYNIIDECASEEDNPLTHEGVGAVADKIISRMKDDVEDCLSDIISDVYHENPEYQYEEESEEDDDSYDEENEDE